MLLNFILRDLSLPGRTFFAGAGVAGWLWPRVPRMSETQHREAAARWLNDADRMQGLHTTQAPFGTVSVAGMIDVTALPPPTFCVRGGGGRRGARARWPPLLRHAYGLVGDRATEFTLHGWTFMSLQKIQDRLALYARHGQTRVCDVAIYYEGMGHFRVLCIDTGDGAVVQRLDGGANDGTAPPLAISPTTGSRRAGAAPPARVGPAAAAPPAPGVDFNGVARSARAHLQVAQVCINDNTHAVGQVRVVRAQPVRDVVVVVDRVQQEQLAFIVFDEWHCSSVCVPWVYIRRVSTSTDSGDRVRQCWPIHTVPASRSTTSKVAGSCAMI